MIYDYSDRLTQSLQRKIAVLMSKTFNNSFQAILSNVTVGGNLSTGDITVIHNALERSAPLEFVKFQHVIPSFSNLVGRKELIREIVNTCANHRIISLLGISGIGKSALMAKVASCLDTKRVFWHEFKAELASLDDVLVRLAHFLDDRSESLGNLSSIIQQRQLPKYSQIERIIEHLNRGNYYLFFDSVDSIESNSELNSFFSLLKEKLDGGTVFVSGCTNPNFYDKIDESNRLVKSIQLEGLNEFGVKEFFRKHRVSVKQKQIKAIANRFDGLPLALELVVTLLKSNFSEADLITPIDELEEEIIDRLFDKIFKITISFKKEIS